MLLIPTYAETGNSLVIEYTTAKTDAYAILLEVPAVRSIPVIEFVCLKFYSVFHRLPCRTGKLNRYHSSSGRISRTPRKRCDDEECGPRLCSRVQSVEEIPNGVSSRDTSPPVARPEGRQRDRCKNDSNEQSFDNRSCSATRCGTGAISPAYGRIGNDPPESIDPD